MTNGNLFCARISDFLEENGFVIAKKEISSDKTTLFLKTAEDFQIEIRPKDVSIFYCGEEDDFFADTFKGENEFLDEIKTHIVKLLRSKVLKESVYAGDVLLYYRILLIDKNTNKKTVYKKVTASLNPFLRFKEKHTTVEEFVFI